MDAANSVHSYQLFVFNVSEEYSIYLIEFFSTIQKISSDKNNSSLVPCEEKYYHQWSELNGMKIIFCSIRKAFDDDLEKMKEVSFKSKKFFRFCVHKRNHHTSNFRFLPIFENFMIQVWWRNFWWILCIIATIANFLNILTTFFWY